MYDVIFTQFTQRYFIKSFRKKYKQAWNVTERALQKQYEYFDILFQKKAAETIIDSPDLKICKTNFTVAGTGTSAKKSGCRCIVAVHKDQKIVHVLLVYHKNNLPKGNETVQWKKMVKDNYPEYRNLLK